MISRRHFNRSKSGRAKPKSSSNQAQIWDIFLFLFFILAVLFGVSYFFVYKFGGIPIIHANRQVGPIERSILPRGTFPFPPSSPPAPKIERAPINRWLNFLLPIPVQAARVSKSNRTLVPILETTITEPNANAVTLEGNTLTVHFNGRNPLDRYDNLYYETILFPLEQNWVKTYGRSRSFNHLAHGFYFFFVRSRDQKGFADPSPAFFSLNVNVADNYGQVGFSVGNPNQLTLTNYSRQSINVAGWRVSSLSSTAIIPPAVNLVDSFFSNTAQAIVLGPNQRLFLHAGNSPLGINFRVNRCFNFLPNRARLNFSSNCHSFTPDELFAIRRRWPVSDRCLQLIQSHACSVPTDREIRSIGNDYICQRFLQNELTYRGCFERHRSEPDFLGNDWHAYITTEQFRFSRYDIISLFDQNGLLVARQRIF